MMPVLQNMSAKFAVKVISRDVSMEVQVPL